MNVACLSIDMYPSVHMDISGTSNHTPKIYHILFACYLLLWLSLHSFIRIGQVFPDMYDLRQVSVPHSGQE